jgi:hypothetical protein
MKHLERYALSVSHEIRDQVFPKQKDLVLGRYPIHINLSSLQNRKCKSDLYKEWKEKRAFHMQSLYSRMHSEKKRLILLTQDYQVERKIR